ncbi:MAG: hypothetical protein AAF253_12140, partial [Pseudomonadota bacterium]
MVEARLVAGRAGRGLYTAEATFNACTEVVTYQVEVVTTRGDDREHIYGFPQVGRFARGVDQSVPETCASNRHAREPRLFIPQLQDIDGANVGTGENVCSNTVAGILTCSLRAAIQEANANDSFDLIRVPPGRYPLTLEAPEGFDVRGGGADDAFGDLDITSSMAIQGDVPTDIVMKDIVRSDSEGTGIFLGPRADEFVVIDANELSRVLHVAEGVDLRLSGVVLTGGRALGGTLFDEQLGGGLFNEGRVDLERVIIAGNGPANTVGLGVGVGNTGKIFGTEVAIVENLGGLDTGAPAIFGGDWRLDRSLIAQNAGGRFVQPIYGANLKLYNSVIGWNGSGGEDHRDFSDNGTAQILDGRLIAINSTFLGSRLYRPFNGGSEAYIANSLIITENGDVSDT